MAVRTRALVAAPFVLLACASPPPAREPPPAAPATTAAAPETGPAVSTAPVPPLSPDADLPPAFADADRRKALEAALPGIDAIVTEEMKAEDIPSVALGVVIDGDVVFAKGYGLADVATGRKADADTVYRIASLSKPFTALAVLQLRDAGKLSLDDTLARWIPEAARIPRTSADSPPMTLRQLLQHTSGLQRDGSYGEKPVSEADVVASLATARAEEAPDVTNAYSNLGYAALGVVAGRAGGNTYRDGLRERLLHPIGMRATAFAAGDVPPDRLALPYARTGKGKIEPALSKHYGEGAGDLFSTVNDLARFAALQLSAYPPRSTNDDGPVKRSSLREAHQPRAHGIPFRMWSRPDPVPGKRDAWGRVGSYGFGWFVKQTCDFDDLVMHGGITLGYTSNLAFLPERGVAVIVLANAGHAESEYLAEETLRLLSRTGALKKRGLNHGLAARFRPSLGAMQALIGAWDDAAYRGMLSAGRPALASEEAELAGYRARHGSCSSFAVKEMTSRSSGRFVFTCERGTLTMDVSFGSDDKVRGFQGTSRGIAAPPARREAATRVAQLLAAWDPKAYRRHFARHAPDAAKAAALFARIRRAHGVCHVKDFEQDPGESWFVLSCEHMGDLALSVEVDEKDASLVKSHTVVPLVRGACPTF